MKPARATFILGGDHTVFIGKHHPDFIWKGHPDFGKRSNPGIEEHLHRAALGALEKAGVPASAIEKGFVGNFTGEIFARQGHLGAILAAAHPDFSLKPFARLEGACASGGLALAAGVDAISAGYDVVLVAGVEVQTTLSARDGADALARAAHYPTERSLDPFTFPCMFARRTRAYCEKHRVPREEIAQVVLKAYGNASKNPYAHMRAFKMTPEYARTASDANPQFLENPEYREWLKVSDCSQVSDGASAAVLVSEQGLARLSKKRADAVELLAYGHATSALNGPRDYTVLTTTAAAAMEAYRDAHVSASDLGVAEVHDCFSIAEIQMYEALGFAPPGRGLGLVTDGTVTRDGRLPVNTGGGLMAFGHPVGATGVKQAVEIFRQMRGLAGDYQVARHPKLGLAANMGGDDRTAVVTIYRAGS
ncbi:MAG TPA: thiolase domain-containing protein [Candidatus Polarisedimenticolia bacterium]|nr:thiolase domain-containing protein [Candidatus Polarisedimenticolia bacterium]